MLIRGDGAAGVALVTCHGGQQRRRDTELSKGELLITGDGGVGVAMITCYVGHGGTEARSFEDQAVIRGDGAGGVALVTCQGATEAQRTQSSRRESC